MKVLTKRQQEVFDFIKSHIRDKGYPPTIREIGGHFGFTSPRTAASHIDVIEKKGFIRRAKGKSRGIEILKEIGSTYRVEIDEEINRGIPVLGRVAGGDPILAEEYIEDYIQIDENMFGSHGGIFGLVVNGNSMSGDGILDGDYVFVKSQPTAETRDIVVAVIGDEATVKRFYPLNDMIRLEPSNPNFGPIFIEKDVTDFRIAGKVIGVLRLGGDQFRRI